MKKIKSNNIVKFPNKISEAEREIEAVIFASSEPLDVESIEKKISKKLMLINVLKILNKII